MSVEDFVYPILKRYMAAPQWLKSSVGGVYRALPARIRLGSRYRAFTEELMVRDAGEIVLRANEKLLRTLRWAIQTVPAYYEYRPLLSENLPVSELLNLIRPVSKDEIKADTERFLSTALPTRSRMAMFTGGSTAAPMRFFLQRHVSRPKESAYVDECFRLAGLESGDVVLSLRGRTVATAGTVGGRLWMYEPIKRHLMLSTDHLEPRFMPGYLEALRQWRPVFIHAFPSALYPLARWLRDNPAPDVAGRIKGVLLTSENVYDYQMDLFRSVFTCPVIKHYGHSERVLMAISMPDDDRYYFWPLYGKFELVDFSGRPINEPGVVGEIVGTGFDNEVMPFIRYRTGDFAVLSDRFHPLLPGSVSCERIEGRLQEFVVCRDNRLISITTLGAAHFEDLAAVDAIQFEQSEPGRLVLKVVMPAELKPHDIQRIVRAVEQKTQGGCSVEVARVSTIERTERGKHKMLVQYLDISGFMGASALE